MDLIWAAIDGNEGAVAALLAGGAAVDAVDETQRRTALHWASWHNHLAVMQQLLQAGASPMAADRQGALPLHLAARRGGEHAVRLLLAAEPAAAATAAASGNLPLSAAAHFGNAAVARLLIEAAPQAAIIPLIDGTTPLQLACSVCLQPLRQGSGNNVPVPEYVQTIRAILPAVPLGEALQQLAAVRNVDALVPVFADLAVRFPLTPAQWRLLPQGKAGLAAALQAVLQRSEVEAAELVKRLPCEERDRLKAAALCLHRAERQAGVELPAPITKHILAMALS